MPHDTTSTLPTLSTLEAVSYLLYGFGVVLATLVLLWLATAAMSKLVKTLGLDQMPAPVSRPNPSPIIPDETIAVITAAVSFATGGKATIQSIRKKP
ncbi:MAG: OadG family protein [Puniceicoccaceae bacterium]